MCPSHFLCIVVKGEEKFASECVEGVLTEIWHVLARYGPHKSGDLDDLALTGEDLVKVPHVGNDVVVIICGWYTNIFTKGVR